MDETEHCGNEGFLPQFQNERLAARLAFAVAAEIFYKFNRVVGALGFIDILTTAVYNVLCQFAVYGCNFLAYSDLSVFNGGVVFKDRVVSKRVANQSASRPATKSSN